MIAELVIVENEADHREAMAIIDKLVSSKRVEDRGVLRAQSLLVTDWESRVYPVEDPEPIEALRFRIEQSGRPLSEIQSIFGGPVAMNEVMEQNRALSKEMAVAAHNMLGVPLDVLFKLLEGEL